VIVRIMGEGQYELPDGIYDELNELDNRVVAAVEAEDQADYEHAFGALIALIRDKGAPLADDDLRESQVIVPPVDLTLEEAKHEFTGEGLLPD
jgi:hypothetical protein